MDPNNSENSNPYDDANYINPSFPKNHNINSGTPNPYPQSDGQGENAQNPYSQNNGQNQNPYSQNNGQNQNPYSQNNGYNPYGQYPANPNSGQPNGNPKRPATGMEIASLILGILSLTCCAGTGIPALIGLILLAVSKSKTKDYSGVGIGGLVCCILGLIIGIIVLAIILGTGFLSYYMDLIESGNARDFLIIYLS